MILIIRQLATEMYLSIVKKSIIKPLGDMHSR